MPDDSSKRARDHKGPVLHQVRRDQGKAAERVPLRSFQPIPVHLFGPAAMAEPRLVPESDQRKHCGGQSMSDLERRALLGDKQAQEECTRRGIVLTCPHCGSSYTQARYMGWNEPAQAFEAGYRGECTVCHTVTGAHKTEKDAIADWNTRPAPPIGRCGECANSPDIATRTKGMRWCRIFRSEVKPDGFCNCFESKGSEHDG